MNMKTGMLAFAVAMLVMSIGASAELPGYIYHRGELADAIESFDGTPHELSDALEYSCNNVNTTAPVKYIMYSFEFPYTYQNINGTWVKVITDTGSMDFMCYYKSIDSASFSTFWSGKYNLTTREVTGMPCCPGTYFDYYHSAFPLIGDWCDQIDIDQDGTTGLDDWKILVSYWGRFNCGVENNWCERSDIDRDGRVYMSDYMKVVYNWGRTGCFGI